MGSILGLFALEMLIMAIFRVVTIDELHDSDDFDEGCHEFHNPSFTCYPFST
jgi:hypothetical protein